MNILNIICVLTTLCTRSKSSPSPPASSIVFPGQQRSLPSPPESNLSLSELPIDLAMKISDLENLDDFFDDLVEPRTKPFMGNILSARFGSGPVERKAFKKAQFARCIPEQTTVKLKPAEADVAKYYLPACTRVARCGGCCNHDLLSCQPTEVEILQLQVVVFEYRGGSKVDYKQNDIVSVEQHKSCKCGCRIKESDCHPYQFYSEESCQCLCSNYDKQEKCNEESATKLWNPNDCSCVCRDVLDCSSGFYFDRYTCQCVSERGIRRNATDYDRLNYSFN